MNESAPLSLSLSHPVLSPVGHPVVSYQPYPSPPCYRFLLLLLSLLSLLLPRLCPPPLSLFLSPSYHHSSLDPLPHTHTNRKQFVSGVGSLSKFRAPFGQFSSVSCTRAFFREDRLSCRTVFRPREIELALC